MGSWTWGQQINSPQNEKELLISTRFIPLSHPHSGAGASLASPNPRDFPEVMHAELYRGNNSQTSAGALHCSSSSNTFVPLLPGNEAPQELSSDSTQHALTNDDDTSKILSSSPNGPMKACSSNQKCMSPPQIQLKDMSLRTSPNLTNEQTIIRLGTPSVRSFSWCSNSKYGIPQVKIHPNDSNGGHFSLLRSFLSYLNPLSYLGTANSSNSEQESQNGTWGYQPNPALQNNLRARGTERPFTHPSSDQSGSTTSRSDERSKQPTASRWEQHSHIEAWWEWWSIQWQKRRLEWELYTVWWQQRQQVVCQTKWLKSLLATYSRSPAAWVAWPPLGHATFLDLFLFDFKNVFLNSHFVNIFL